MIPLKIKIEGISVLRSNIRILQNLVREGTIKGLSDGLNDLEKASSDYLDNMINWGVSATRPEDSINNNWVKVEPQAKGSIISATLENHSPHAYFVEVGTTGPIKPTGPNPMSFIYYGQEMARWAVKGQQPMRYLTTGMQIAKPFIQNHLIEDIRKSIRIGF